MYANLWWEEGEEGYLSEGEWGINTPVAALRDDLEEW